MSRVARLGAFIVATLAVLAAGVFIMDGDTQKDLLLTEARAMVIREYLVENFGFDDSQLKTLGMGKTTGANLEADWGSIQIFIYPAGTEIPANKPTAAVSSSATEADKSEQVTAAAAQKP